GSGPGGAARPQAHQQARRRRDSTEEEAARPGAGGARAFDVRSRALRQPGRPAGERLGGRLERRATRASAQGAPSEREASGGGPPLRRGEAERRPVARARAISEREGPAKLERLPAAREREAQLALLDLVQRGHALLEIRAEALELRGGARRREA